MLDSKFSQELKDIISQSREIAIDLGYDYISTIHFFLADCESKRDDSILAFAFKDEIEYQSFKKNYSLEKDENLDLTNETLVLTKEAEVTIKLSKNEWKLQKHDLILPSHLFIASLKNKESLLSKCFAHDENALADLTKFYEHFNKKNNREIINEEQFKESEQREKRVTLSFINLIKRIFRY